MWGTQTWHFHDFKIVEPLAPLFIYFLYQTYFNEYYNIDGGPLDIFYVRISGVRFVDFWKNGHREIQKIHFIKYSNHGYELNMYHKNMTGCLLIWCKYWLQHIKWHFCCVSFIYSVVFSWIQNKSLFWWHSWKKAYACGFLDI